MFNEQYEKKKKCALRAHTCWARGNPSTKSSYGELVEQLGTIQKSYKLQWFLVVTYFLENYHKCLFVIHKLFDEYVDITCHLYFKNVMNVFILKRKNTQTILQQLENLFTVTRKTVLNMFLIWQDCMPITTSQELLFWIGKLFLELLGRSSNYISSDTCYKNYYVFDAFCGKQGDLRASLTTLRSRSWKIELSKLIRIAWKNRFD